MPSPPDNFEDFYQKLRGSYLVRLGGSVAAIDNILGQSQLTPLGRETLDQAIQLAHGLAGSGSTFGFQAVTDAGRKVDTYLSGVAAGMAPGASLSPKEFAVLEPLMLELRAACVAAANSESEHSGKNEAPRKSASRKTFSVMIVDDDTHVPALLTQKLQQKNIRVAAVPDGNAALEQLQSQRPDLLVLDIEMPGLSGHEILRRLKQNPDFVSLPVLMLTGQAQQEDVVSALHAGALDYIVKPVDMDKLVSRIEKILDASRFNVLIADNDPLILQLLESKFRHRGFQVRLAEDGKRALDMVTSYRPDIVILDRMMPGMEGLAILDTIRSNDATKEIPVVILSARKNDRDIENGLSRGAQAYIVKPFIPEDLINRCLKLLHTGETAA